MITGRSGIFKNKKARLAAVLAMVAVLAAGGVIYFLLGGKSARDFYLDAEGKNFQQYAQWMKKTHADFKEARQPYKTGNYKSRTEITLDVKGEEGAASDKTANGLLDVLGKCKLVVDSRNSPVDKWNLTELSLLLEKTPFLDAEVFSKGRELYFTVPVFTPDRYFKLDTGRLEEVYDRFNIPVKPLRVPSLVDAADAIELDAEVFDSLLGEYGGFISQGIKDEDVSFGKTVETEISGQSAKGREVSVNLNKAAFTALLNGLSAKAGGDDVFARLTYGNFAAVAEIVDEAGIFRLFDYLEETGALALNETEKALLQAVNVKKDLVDGFKKELGGLFESCDFTDGLKMDLIIDRSGNILKREAVIAMKNIASGTEYEVTIHTGTNSLKHNDYRNRYLEVEIVTKSGDEGGSRQYFRFQPQLEPSSKDGNRGKIGISWGIDTDSGIHSSTTVGLKLDASTDELTSKENSSVAYTIEMEGNNEGQPEKLTGEVKTSRWKNNKLKTRNQTTALAINAELPDFGVTGFSAVLNLAREDRLEMEAFTLPEAAAGVVDLNTATDEELDKVWEEIMGSFGTFYMINKSIVDAVLGE